MNKSITLDYDVQIKKFKYLFSIYKVFTIFEL